MVMTTMANEIGHLSFIKVIYFFRKIDESNDVSRLSAPQPSVISRDQFVMIAPMEHIGQNRNKEKYAIKYGFVHPMYIGGNYYDIAVARLWRPINMSTVQSRDFKDINGLCFPPKWSFNTEYEHALLVGQGTIGDTVYNASTVGWTWTGWARIYPINRGGHYFRDDYGEIVRTRMLVREGDQSTCEVSDTLSDTSII